MKYSMIAGLLLLVAGVLFVPPLLERWQVAEPLGDGVILSRRGEVLFRDGDHNRVLYFVPTGCEAVAADGDWVIARSRVVSGFGFEPRSRNGEVPVTDYWIIYKRRLREADPDREPQTDLIYHRGEAYPVWRECLLGPLDSVTFTDMVRMRNIRLQW